MDRGLWTPWKLSRGSLAFSNLLPGDELVGSLGDDPVPSPDCVVGTRIDRAFKRGGVLTSCDDGVESAIGSSLAVAFLFVLF